MFRTIDHKDEKMSLKPKIPKKSIRGRQKAACSGVSGPQERFSTRSSPDRPLGTDAASQQQQKAAQRADNHPDGAPPSGSQACDVSGTFLPNSLTSV